MAIIEFSVLSYYTTLIGDECITLGILFHNLTTNERVFEITTNWRRLASFDDELDIEFVKEYLKGIKYTVERNILNYNDNFSIREFIKHYVNEFRFGSVQSYRTDEVDDFIEKTKKIFLRFDYNKKERLNKNEERAYIRELLKSNRIEYSTKKISGKYDDNIKFDYVIGDYGIKIFIFEGKSLSHLISAAKTWSYNAYELKDKIKTVFIYDIERTDSEYFKTIMSILKEHSYQVLKFEEGFKFLLSLNNNNIAI
ncbi:Protein of unknown function [Caloranaerobacter azorensis DSM 13643]|uniref:DUF3037 domain-containing protein n=1 Tax=Caloranaerobacter azorensis DSM 13643 TaxID=1121264 RepID=A0A1M5VLG0_9FIRM|nr:DUF3037 domain-containing protein [Caloranaerobacter azorensis]SHH76065.1 Protein of unknown function [Caloranaerobacter azorensis DSM 13643]